MKKIFITGADGFIGKNLCAYLERNHFAGGKATLIKNNEDVRDTKALKRIFERFHPHYVIHLAAKSTVEEGRDNPKETFDVNVNGTLNMLEMTRLYKPAKTIIISTIHVYGNNSHVPLKEDYFPQPSRPYETSKACADIMAQTYAESYNLPVEIPRFVNIYGPGDLNFSRLIPKLVRSIIRKGAVDIWGGNITREYLYIEDAISALIKLLTANREKLEKNRVINFGSDEQTSVREIAQKLIVISKKSISIHTLPIEMREREIETLYMSSAKAKRLLGWKPKVHLDEGLTKTYTWYEQYFSHKKDGKIGKLI